MSLHRVLPLPPALTDQGRAQQWAARNDSLEQARIMIDGKAHKGLAWYYRLPSQECAAIAGLVCFYNEKVDIILNGERLKRPVTHFS